MTDKETLDRRVMPALIEQVEEPLAQVSADGAYDYKQCYQAIANREARASIPPRADARMKRRVPFAERDKNIGRIAEVGRKEWKQECRYHRRSLAETAVLRVKTIFGDKVAARKFTSQAVELKIKGAALNRMTSLGMPDSYAI